MVITLTFTLINVLFILKIRGLSELLHQDGNSPEKVSIRHQTVWIWEGKVHHRGYDENLPW